MMRFRFARRQQALCLDMLSVIMIRCLRRQIVSSTCLGTICILIAATSFVTLDCKADVFGVVSDLKTAFGSFARLILVFL
jgi:hypothetical protein